MFLDETGAIARDRFFGIGLVRAAEPAVMLRAVQKVRDRRHWYQEMHFTSAKARDVWLYQEVVDAAVQASGLASVSVTQLDSRSSDGPQLADVFTSAIAHEFRADAGLASSTGPKAVLAAHVRQALGADSCLTGWRTSEHSVQRYEHGAWTPGARG